MRFIHVVSCLVFDQVSLVLETLASLFTLVGLQIYMNNLMVPEVEFVHAVSAGGSVKFLPAV